MKQLMEVVITIASVQIADDGVTPFATTQVYRGEIECERPEEFVRGLEHFPWAEFSQMKND